MSFVGLIFHAWRWLSLLRSAIYLLRFAYFLLRSAYFVARKHTKVSQCMQTPKRFSGEVVQFFGGRGIKALFICHINQEKGDVPYRRIPQ